MWKASRKTGRLVLRMAFLLSALALAGCSRPLPVDPDVPTDVKIGQLVRDVDDFAHDGDEITVVPRLFVPGRGPSDTELPRYADYHYQGEPPVQKGDAATVVVHVTDAKTGSSLGEVTWSMKKLNEFKDSWNSGVKADARGNTAGKGIWKLTEAPLPAK